MDKVQRVPWITYLLVSLNILVFINTFHFGTQIIVDAWGFIPSQANWFSAISCMFIHFSFGHLLGNMCYLLVYGIDMEILCGPWLFLMVYLVSHFIGLELYSLTVLHNFSDLPLVGASFAISGIMGAYIVLLPYNKLRSLSSIFSFSSQNHGIRAWLPIGYWFVYQLWMANSALKHAYSIGYWGHIGGFLSGVGIGCLMRRYYFRREDLLLDQEKAFEFEEKQIQKKDKEIEQILTEQDKAKEEMVQKVNETLQKDGLGAGVEEYKKLANLPVDGILAAGDQKSIADELFRRGDDTNALQAYLKFLSHFPNHIAVSEISCRVGCILSNIKGDESTAIRYLVTGIADKTLPQTMQDNAQQSLAKVRSRIKNLEKSPVPRSHSGQYSLLLFGLDKTMVDFQAIRKYLTEIGIQDGIDIGTKLSFNAEELASTNDGLILDRINLKEAQVAREKLLSKGLDVIILPKGDHTGYPILSLFMAWKTNNGFVAKDEDGREIHCTQSSVLHSAFAQFFFEEYGVGNEDKSQLIDVTANPTATIATGKDGVISSFDIKSIGFNCVLDIFTIDLKHYRISSRKFTYVDKSTDLDSHDHFGQFVKDYISVVGEQKLDFYTKLFAANNTFSGLTYKNVAEFEKRSLISALYKFYYPSDE